MIEKLLTRLGNGIALFLMVLELTYINAKSLLFIVDEFYFIDKFFAIIGALGFSIVTVLVMRKSNSQWMKITFPLFDSILVFCGFNIKYADNLFDNPVRFWLTVIMAVFTGLIMYSIGQIKYGRRKRTNLKAI